MIVLWSNMRNKELDRLPVFKQFWGVPFAGCWPKSYIPMPPNRELTDIDLQDPYDVSGTWLRVSLSFIHTGDPQAGPRWNDVDRLSASLTTTTFLPSTFHHTTIYPITSHGPTLTKPRQRASSS